MSIAKDIIEKVCIHESGHAIVAIALGFRVLSIDVFNTLGRPGAQATSCEYYGPSEPLAGGTVAMAGEQAEWLFCPSLVHVYDYVQTYRSMAGQLPVPAGSFATPAQMGDMRAVVKHSIAAGRRDVQRFAEERSAVAAEILRLREADVRREADKLRERCEAAGIACRVPADGVPGDGPHWRGDVASGRKVSSVVELVRLCREKAIAKANRRP